MGPANVSFLTTSVMDDACLAAIPDMSPLRQCNSFLMGREKSSILCDNSVASFWRGVRSDDGKLPRQVISLREEVIIDSLTVGSAVSAQAVKCRRICRSLTSLRPQPSRRALMNINGLRNKRRLVQFFSKQSWSSMTLSPNLKLLIISLLNLWSLSWHGTFILISSRQTSCGTYQHVAYKQCVL